MTRIHFAADHGGFEIGRALESRARSAGHDVVWHGADVLDPGDDYPLLAIRAGAAVVSDQDAGIDAFGVLVMDEPQAAAVAANKVNGVRAITSESPKEAIHGRAIVDANVLVLDGVAFEDSAWLSVAAFVASPMEATVTRGRQILQIEEYENSGTIEGWAVQLEPQQIAIRHDAG